MEFQPSPMQVLILWKMIFLNDQPTFSKVDKKTRQPLIDAGIVEIEKKGRKSFLVLSETAWDWAVENLDAKVSTRSPQSGPVLQQVLTVLKHFMKQNNVSLYEFIQAKQIQPEGAATVPPQETAAHDKETIASRIRQAYFNHTHGKTHERMRLATLRQLLSDIPRQELDDVLKDLKRTQKILLFPFEDPQDIFESDGQAALYEADRMNHVIIIKE